MNTLSTRIVHSEYNVSPIAVVFNLGGSGHRWALADISGGRYGRWGGGRWGGGRHRIEVGADVLREALTATKGGGGYSFSKEGSYSVQLKVHRQLPKLTSHHQ